MEDCPLTDQEIETITQVLARETVVSNMTLFSALHTLTEGNLAVLAVFEQKKPSMREKGFALGKLNEATDILKKLCPEEIQEAIKKCTDWRNRNV